MATAAVTLPALAAVGWAVARPEPIGTSLGSRGDSLLPEFTTSTSPGPGQYRCNGEVGSDGEWTYFEYCEPTGAGVATMPTVFVTFPPPTTALIDPAALTDHVLFVDGTGRLGVAADLASRLGFAPRYLLPATRVVEQTMVMPTGADVSYAYDVLGVLGIGGFDSWTPDLIDGDLPDGIAAVVVVGTDWLQLSELAQLDCVQAAVATTVMAVPPDGLPEGVPAPTTMWPC